VDPIRETSVNNERTGITVESVEDANDPAISQKV